MSNLKQSISDYIQQFTTQNLTDESRIFFNTLGYHTDRELILDSNKP